jgi:hypothetical protein
MGLDEINMTTAQIKTTAKNNRDEAIVAGKASVGAGWYAIMLWPSATMIEDNYGDIGAVAEREADRLAHLCGLMTEAKYDRAQKARRAELDQAELDRLNSPQGQARRLAKTNVDRAMAGLASLRVLTTVKPPCL